MNVIADKIAGLWPEMILMAGACLCLLLGLLNSPGARRLTAGVAGLSLLAAGAAAWWTSDRGGLSGYPAGLVAMTAYVKLAVAAVGFVLLLVAASVPDEVLSSRAAETPGGRGHFRDHAGGAKSLKAVPGFDPALVLRGEFFGFFLLSLAGVMLTAGANDLVWLFLALELTSLPTYVMVATARDRGEAQESAVKYFFLGAMAAAVFLYGFALLYGAAGTTQLYATASDPDAATLAGFAADLLASGRPLPPLMIAGGLLAILGICFKIAAFPMHFYAADVYQGAATPVTAFLAFVPKAAGFVAIILLLGLFAPGGGMGGFGGASGGASGGIPPRELAWLLWGIAAATMTLGNVLGLLQRNVKRVLAYSSVAHSGYMLVGLAAGAAGTPANYDTAAASAPLGQGVAAVLFYLVAYALATVAAFAVLGCLRARGEEAQTYDDLGGLARRQPGLAVVMLLAVLSLTGLPLTVGFVGKLYLFGSAIDHGLVGLVVLALVNSAVSAVYYLRIAGACFFGEPAEDTQAIHAPARRLGAALAAAAAIVLGVLSGPLVEAAREAAPSGAEPSVPRGAVQAPPPAADIQPRT